MASSSSADNLNQDHYGVLGIERRASQDDVRSAYRLRSHMFHPDKYENYPEPLRSQLLAEAAKEFKKLTAAYDTLRDPSKRAVYDRQAAGWSRSAPAPRTASRGSTSTRAPSRASSARTASKRGAPRATVRDAGEADSEDEQQAQREAERRAQREERARRAAEAAARPRERDPMLVVRPDSLDFGALALG